MISKVLVTGGRSPVALDLMRSLSYCGYQVYAAESIPVYLSRASRVVHRHYQVPKPNQAPLDYIVALEAIIRKENIEHLIPTCEETYFVAWGRERLAKSGCRVFTEQLEILRMLHSKWEFVEFLRNQHILFPPTVLVQTDEEIKCCLERLPSGKKYILKPVFSRFAAKVIEIVAPGKDILTVGATPTQPWVLQEYISGKAYCSYSIVRNGNIAAHATYEPSFTAGRGAAICFSAVQHAGIKAWAEHVCHILNFTGQISFDFIESPEGRLYPLECNPRATSGLHFFNAQQIACAFFGVPPMTGEPSTEPKMLALAMLIYGFTGDRARWFESFRKSKDVIFDKRDLGPSLYQCLPPLYFAWLSQINRKSVLEATTLDIEWNGESL